MDVYFVKPNLQILSCDSCPTEENLVSKKSVYLSLLDKCSQLQQISEHESAIPTWCTNESEDSSDLSSGSSTPSIESLNTLNAKKSSPESLTIEKQSSKGSRHNDNKDAVSDILNFPLQSLKLSPEDCYRETRITDSLLLTKLNLPSEISSTDNKWIALKYLQLSTDVALLQYKYLKSYTKINKLVKKYFSKPDISESQEAKGFKCISYEMNKFKSLENVLTLLLRLQEQFQTRFSNTSTTAKMTVSAGTHTHTPTDTQSQATE